MTALKFTNVSAKIGKVKPETKSIAEEVFAAAQKAGHDVWYIWGMGTGDEHKTGLALDLMVHNEAAGDFVRNYLWTNRKRLRLKHVIWEQHITSTVVNVGVRRVMEDRGDPTANHYDHVHTLHFPGKYQAPPVKPAATKPVTSKPESSAADEPLEVDGVLGPKTIKRWQEIMNNPTGKTGVWSSNWCKFLQSYLTRVDHRLEVDGVWGPESIRTLQRYLKTPVDGVVKEDQSVTIKALQRRLNTGKF